MNIVDLTTANFDAEIAKHSLVVIDFWAEWCGPCKSFAQVLETVAAQSPDVLFGKVNIEQESALAEEFQVRSIPAVMVLRDQVVVYADSGALSASALTELLQQARSLSSEELRKQVEEQE